MPKAVSRPSFTTSSTDFALPPSSSSNTLASTSSLTLDEPSTLFQRFRRPSLLVPKAVYLSEARLGSPLAASFTFHSRRRSQTTFNEESESDKERRSMVSSSGNSGDPISSLKGLEPSPEGIRDKPKLSRPPSTPPRRLSIPSGAMDTQDSASLLPGRRLTFPIKPPRILNLLAESRPEENEVQSEAAFQRLITSCSELPRTPRPLTDRGRYPEEAVQEETQREESPSDDDDHFEETPFAFLASEKSQPIPIKKPALSNTSTDDLHMSVSQTSSNGTLLMDVDVPPSPSLSSIMSTSVNGWRYTPPPTTSAVRSNKRKLEDRFDPYPTTSKRRAVSPSLAYLRESHSAIGSPMNMNGRNGRLPISIPINVPGSSANSATSSPTIGSYSGSFSRSVSIASSPTLRSTVLLASPILRPVPRIGKRGDEEEREIDGAGEAVNGLTLA